MSLERSQTPRGRQCASRRHVLVIAFGLVAFVHATVDIMPTTGSAAEVARHPGGFWKCRPPGNVKGAFDNEDPVALAANAHVATDCALHWSDGHGATYCFATPPSLLEFKDHPEILEKAQAFWRASHARK